MKKLKIKKSRAPIKKKVKTPLDEIPKKRRPIRTEVKWKDKDTKISEKPEAEVFEGHKALSIPHIYLEKGVTKNLGDYNSARVSIGMYLPIDYNDDDLEKAKEAIEVANEIVVKRLEEELEELKGGV